LPSDDHTKGLGAVFQLKVGGKVELEMDSYGELHIRPKEASGSEKHSDDGEES